MGFRDDYSVNSLQLSNGVTTNGDVVFSETGRLAGVAHTDWSWSALFADFDNDGNKDIFIGNGYPKAVNDLDYQTAMFAARRGGTGTASRRARWEILTRLPAYEEPNYVFRNSGDLTFADKTRAWVAAGFLVTSSQFVFTSMTAYAMPAHLAINLLWLYAFLRGDRAGWFAAPLIGVVALGLHNPFPHALFVTPFLVSILLRLNSA